MRLARHTREALVAQLTGRSSNLYSLDFNSRITHALRAPRGMGQGLGEVYTPPDPQPTTPSEEHAIVRGTFATLSAAADDYYRKIEAEQAFLIRAAELVGRLRKEVNRKRKLRANLEQDLLIMAVRKNTNGWAICCSQTLPAPNEGQPVLLHDYYAEGVPVVEIEVDENISLQEAASESFSRYVKAKRAIEEIGLRLAQTEKEATDLEARLARLQDGNSPT